MQILRPLLFLFLFSLLSAAGARAEFDPMINGPAKVETGEYKLPAVVDPDVLPSVATELWARVFWPTDAFPGARPILFFLHGNHNTCAIPGKIPGTHDDPTCEYTDTGTCPAGMVPAPNHEGYNYAAQHLASHGYVVVSVNANRGITCGNAVRGDEFLNLARGRLVLRHLELWQSWNRGEASSPELTPDAHAFRGRIDLSRVGFVGHSRGGEGMRAALSLLRDKADHWQHRLPDARVRGIFEIGAVDGQTGRTLNAEGVAWNQLIPLCDGDVPELEGRVPFERMWQRPGEDQPTPKSLFLVWGANHNFFNTEWQSNDAARCPGQTKIHGAGPWSETQQAIGRASLVAFFRANVPAAGERPAPNLFDPARALPKSLTSLTRIDRDFLPTLDRRYFFPIQAFDGLSPTDPQFTGSGVTIRRNLAHPNYVRIQWPRTEEGGPPYAELTWRWPYGEEAAARAERLAFRVGVTEEPNYGYVPAQDFSFALVLANGELSRPRPVSAYASVLSPPLGIRLFQTVSVPLSDFALTTEERAGIKGIRFFFPPTGGTTHLTGFHFSAPLAQ